MHDTGLSGKIESVNGAMLKSLLEEESDLVVFMYREDNRWEERLEESKVKMGSFFFFRVDEAILYTMDELDQALDKEDVKMVSINVEGIEKDYGLYGLPLLIHFNGNIPRVFDGIPNNSYMYCLFIDF